MNDIIRAVEAEQLKTDLPVMKVGDTVKVYVKLLREREKDCRHSRDT